LPDAPFPPAEELAANVRRLANLPPGIGPDDRHLHAGVVGFVEQFDYWYIRVMRGAVAQYRNLIVKRINPFIRRIEYEGLSASATATRLVEDYNNRNFVTAGGWALEKLAVATSPDSQKSPAAGIDAQRFDPTSGDYHLYVLKSGLVTRNSDIISQLKRNARQAEKVLKQDKGTGAVHANYAILAGKTTSTFEDGVRRPSSAEFWGEMFKLPQDQAIDLAFALAAEAGRLVRTDSSQHVVALKTLVTVYIGRVDAPDVVDWEFIARRNMRDPSTWRAEDRHRHRAALAALTASGYQFVQDAAAPEAAATEDGALSDNPSSDAG